MKNNEHNGPGLFLSFFFFFSQEKPNKFQSTEMKDYRAKKPTNQYKATKDLVLLDIITKVYPFSFLFSFTYLRTICLFFFFCFFIIFFTIFNFLYTQMVDLEEKWSLHSRVCCCDFYVQCSFMCYLADCAPTYTTRVLL